MTRKTVGVDVATVWTSPEAPRPLDEAAVRDVPDPAGWAASLDEQTRMDLHGRTLTQLLRGEPVEVLDEGGDGWVRVAAPWQPAPEHTTGYPGWIRAAHLQDRQHDGPVLPAPEVSADPMSVVAAARRFLGLQYLWGGMSRWGLDCSGLVHYAFRLAGVVVPRDAHAQEQASLPVALGDEQPGDLYFFARPDGRVFHVGFVTGPGAMLHAPETGGGGLIEDAPLPETRLAALVSAGRFHQPAD